MLERLSVRTIESYPDRPYERVVATAHYAIDPGEDGAARIADLGLVAPDEHGRVRFTGDVVLLRPTGGQSERALLVVPNRGTASLPFSGPVTPTGLAAAPPPGSGYLLDHGWTIAFPGWQWDVPQGFIGLRAPELHVEAGWLRAEFRSDAPFEKRSLGDVVPGGPGLPTFDFAAYPTADLDDPAATLRVRTSQLGVSEEIPRGKWRFTSATTIALQGGFLPYRWYEVIYRTSYATVVGVGLLALRDFGSYLRQDFPAVFAHGISQTGRVLREYLFEGLNLDEAQRPVFDGMFLEIASARRGEFNRRFAQPSLLSPMMPEYGPPYDTAGLLARQRSRGGVPKLMLANSAWEYWRGDGALVHQDPQTGADLPEDADARVHLISGTDHLGPMGDIKARFPLENPPHDLDPAPILRALFVQLQDWALNDIPPEASKVPRTGDGTAVPRAEALAVLPPNTAPDLASLPYTPAIDPEETRWPLPLGGARIALVSALDAAGNEVAGIRLPAVEAGIASYTGWNPRCHVDGLPDVLYDMLGSRLDPPAEHTTPSEADLRHAAEQLAAHRFVLPEDIDGAVDQAVEELRSRQQHY